MALGDILQRCKDGDPEALGFLVARYTAQVYRWAVFLGLRPADAEDAAQEVLALALQRIHTCEAPGALRSWLFQITRRVVANARRLAWVRRILLRHQPERPAFAFESQVELEQQIDLQRCLDRLSRRQVEVLLLVEVEGLTLEQAGRALGVAKGTVASRLRLARAALRREWERGSARAAASKPTFFAEL